MKRKLTATLLSLMLVLSMTFTSFAADIDLSEGSGSTGTSPSEFDASDNASSVTVRIPANLNLDFSQELDSYQISANVGVYGDVKDFAEIAVSIDDQITYYDTQVADGSGGFSKTFPAQVPEDEDFPYQYKFQRWIMSTNTASSLTKTITTFKSKYPIFMADNPGSVAYQNASLYKLHFYVYKDGNAITTQFTPNTVGSESPASSTLEAGAIVMTSHTAWEYRLSDGVLRDTGNTSFTPSFSTDFEVIKDYDTFVTNIGLNGTTGKIYTYLNNYETYAEVIRFNGLVFDSMTEGRDYYRFNNEEHDAVTGYVLFGENTDGVCTEVWNSEQASAPISYDGDGNRVVDNDAIDNRVITINVPNYEVHNPGIYYATAEFDIGFTCVGMKSDVSAATKLADREIVNGTSYSWNTTYTSTAKALNLNNCGNKGFTIATPALAANDSFQNIKYLQLADNTTTDYYTYIDDSDPANCNSWINGMKGLSVIVIPKTVTTAQLHSTIGNTTDYTEAETNNNDITAVFETNNKKIGNALCFMKSISAEGKFIYVPHIAFRGTKDEFKALSGFDNWVFGNAGNIVTVHCTDGIMYY